MPPSIRGLLRRLGSGKRAALPCSACHWRTGAPRNRWRVRVSTRVGGNVRRTRPPPSAPESLSPISCWIGPARAQFMSGSATETPNRLTDYSTTRVCQYAEVRRERRSRSLQTIKGGCPRKRTIPGSPTPNRDAGSGRLPCRRRNSSAHVPSFALTKRPLPAGLLRA